MNKYIDKEAAKQLLINDRAFAAAELLDYIPAADVVEVRHGQNISKAHPVDEFVCSECGLIMRDLSEVRIDEENEDECYYEFEFKYCPDCGAKMDGKKDGAK